MTVGLYIWFQKRWCTREAFGGNFILEPSWGGGSTISSILKKTVFNTEEILK